MIFTEYKNLYPKYFESNGKYFYGSVGKWLIVYSKSFFTKTNENRKNIVNPIYAEYKANLLNVSLIIEKINPSNSIRELEYEYYCEILTFVVGKNIKPKQTKISFYKSYIPAYYSDLFYHIDNKKTFSESYITFYQSGRISSEGQYLNGQIHGKWIYWFNFTDPKRQSEKSFTAEYENGVLIEKTEYHNDKQINKIYYNKKID